MSGARRVLVAGSANLDVVVRVPHIAAPGETVLGHDLATYPGGKGANQAVACARAGDVATDFLVALGDDAAGETLGRALFAAGVDAIVVRVPDRATGTAFISLADDAENAITVAPGANAALAASHLPPLAPYGHLLLQLETPVDTVAAFARAARAAGVATVLNAAPARALPRALLDDVDVLIVNEGELAQLAGSCAGSSAQSSIRDAAVSLRVACVVVTLGRLGAIAITDDAVLHQPAFAVDARDTTGAGDTFCGAFVAALHRRDALPDALREASAAAALACRETGAQSSIPTRDAVSRFLATDPATTGPVAALDARVSRRAA